MKKTLYIIPLLVTLTFLYGFLKVNESNPNNDAAATYSTVIGSGNVSDTTPPSGFPYPTVFNFYYANIANLNAGTVGAIYVMGKYYFNRWNATSTYISDSTGTNGGPSTTYRTVSYIGSIRDMTTDGRYLYGGAAAATLYRFDTNMTTLTTWSISGAQFRAVAWDPGRHGFWNCNFAGNITCNDTASHMLGSITNSYDAKYGLGFDSVYATDTGFVWCWDQGPASAGPNRLTKFRASTGTLMVFYNFALVQAGIAGGAEIVVYPNPSRQTLLLNYQNVAMCGYKMRDIVTYIESHQKMIEGFSLSQNFPNPFNPSTKISFSLMKMTNVNLSVYDVLGNRVKTIIDGVIEAGEHNISFNASDLSSGVYFYTITAGDFKDTKKMLLVK